MIEILIRVMLARLIIMTLDEVTQICERNNRNLQTNGVTTQLVLIVSLDILQTKNALISQPNSLEL